MGVADDTSATAPSTTPTRANDGSINSEAGPAASLPPAHGWQLLSAEICEQEISICYGEIADPTAQSQALSGDVTQPTYGRSTDSTVSGVSEGGPPVVEDSVEQRRRRVDLVCVVEGRAISERISAISQHLTELSEESEVTTGGAA